MDNVATSKASNRIALIEAKFPEINKARISIVTALARSRLTGDTPSIVLETANRIKQT